MNLLGRIDGQVIFLAQAADRFDMIRMIVCYDDSGDVTEVDHIFFKDLSYGPYADAGVNQNPEVWCSQVIAVAAASTG